MLHLVAPTAVVLDGHQIEPVGVPRPPVPQPPGHRHLAEDVAIALAQTIDKALGDRTRVRRFGYALVPMDEAAASVTIDLVKRQYQGVQLKLSRDSIEGMPREDLEHFCRSLAQNLNACTHIIVEYGDNDHHKVEAAIKAFAVALRMAVELDPKRKGIPSTKGAM